ncbi:MAG: hypothetical protein IJD50_06660 [Clostridia bacterium]|nr:hypothetical protein [Clostridia bacterium]
MKRQYKWIAFLICFILMFALGVEITPLSERAIVAGLGIDYDNGVFTISAQILLPSSDDSKTSNIVVSSAKGETIGEALAKISSESSMLVATSHCNLVLLGEGTLNGKAYSSLDYMIRNAYLSENALILTTEGTAKDILNAKTAYSDMTSFYIQRELMVYGNYKEAVHRNIKEYLSSYYTENSANWLTKVRKVETEKPQTGGSTSAGSSSGSGSDDKVYVLDFARCAIIKGDNFVFDGNEDVISGINLLTSTLDKGDVVISDGEYTYCFYIVKSKSKLSYKPENFTAKASLKVDILLKEIVSSSNETLPFSVIDVEPDSKVDGLLKEYFNNVITRAFEECKSHEVDIFDLYGGFYGKMGRKWIDYSKNYLEKSVLLVDTEITYY